VIFLTFDPPLKGEVAAAQPLTEGCPHQRLHPSVSPSGCHLPLWGRITSISLQVTHG